MIQIPKPCSKNWNQLSGDEKQRFCESCGKNVINLDVKSDESIELINSKKNVCIKISYRNLNSLNRQSKTFSRLTLFTSLLFSSFLFGQNDSIQIKGIVKDLNGFPVMDSKIILKDYPFQSISDEEGKFILKVPKDLIKYTLIAKESENQIEITFKEEDLLQELIIPIENPEDVLIGEVIYLKPTFKQRVINTITWPYRKIRKTFFDN